LENRNELGWAQKTDPADWASSIGTSRGIEETGLFYECVFIACRNNDLCRHSLLTDEPVDLMGHSEDQTGVQGPPIVFDMEG
jgi:hypothetical protein